MKYKEVYKYLKGISEYCKLPNEEATSHILYDYFSKMKININCALCPYLDSSIFPIKENMNDSHALIFPFGCNQSQFKAVEKALNQQISVIQGPPGTGKTQTILNIVANLLIRGKTVQIVSNNNAALENVRDKLSSPECDLSFMVAVLGKRENKKHFINNQAKGKPNLKSWVGTLPISVLEERIRNQSKRMKGVFQRKEKLATASEENVVLRIIGYCSKNSSD